MRGLSFLCHIGKQRGANQVSETANTGLKTRKRKEAAYAKEIFLDATANQNIWTKAVHTAFEAIPERRAQYKLHA